MKIKKSLKCLIGVVFVFLVYFCLDYFNIASSIGLQFNNVNSDLFSILFNTLIVVILYIISFFYLESRQKKKDDDARSIATVLFKKSYSQCQECLQILEKKTFLELVLLPEITKSNSPTELECVKYFRESPFYSKDTIMSLATNGFVSREQIETYLYIKKEYEFCIDIKVTCCKNIIKGDTDFDFLNDKCKDLANKLEEEINKV